MSELQVIEIGAYVSVAYAGMVLAEQGARVTKWLGPREDPIQGLEHGKELWAWINAGKNLIRCDAETITRISGVQIVLDNVRASAWERWGVDPDAEAKRMGCAWVSLRDDLDGRSFDAIAQARAWGDHLGYLPAYLGDTTAGLWMAFKALAARPGHHVLHQSACLAKLVEGELVVTAHRDGFTPPWDPPGSYGPDGDGVSVIYRGETCHEPFRDDEWRREHLRHADGRYVI